MTRHLVSTPNRTLYYDGAYAPFGESYAETYTADRSFTGQNQDTAQGLYDFLFREFSGSQQGRWISPDPAGLAAVDLTNPQTWNRYAYVGNNPLRSADPLGLKDCDGCDDGPYSFFGQSSAGLFDWLSGGIGPNPGQAPTYVIDGIETPAAIAQSLINSGAAGNCPQCLPGQMLGVDGEIYGMGQHFVVDANCILTFPENSSDSCNSGSFVFFLADEGHNVGEDPLSGLDNSTEDEHPGLRAFYNNPDCPNCGNIFASARTVVKAAEIGTFAVPAVVVLGSAFLDSAAGEFLFNGQTGLLNSNDFLRIGWSGVGPNVLDYLPVGGAVFRIAIGATRWGWPFPIHFP